VKIGVFSKMTEKLSFTLIENSFCFLESAIKYSKEKERRDWKYAILNLANALELMMKAVLEKEHWSLVFESIDSASREKIIKGNFQSVNFETSINRLENIVNFKLSASDLKYLKKIRDIRNKITHFSFEINIEETKSIVARGLGVFIKLYKKIDTYKNADDILHFINSELIEFEKYVKLRLAEIKDDLRASKRPDKNFYSCPSCLQNTIIINTNFDELFCKFCGAKFSYNDVANYSGGNGGSCPECENGRLAFVVYNSEEGEFICTKCGFKSDYSYNVQCTSCQNTYWDENGNDDYLCESCYKSNYD
jgi:hypothetical protein